jgi:hypothetical protein
MFWLWCIPRYRIIRSWYLGIRSYGLTGSVQPVAPSWGADGFDPYMVVLRLITAEFLVS